MGACRPSKLVSFKIDFPLVKHKYSKLWSKASPSKSNKKDKAIHATHLSISSSVHLKVTGKTHQQVVDGSWKRIQRLQSKKSRPKKGSRKAILIFRPSIIHIRVAAEFSICSSVRIIFLNSIIILKNIIRCISWLNFRWITDEILCYQWW